MLEARSQCTCGLQHLHSDLAEPPMAHMQGQIPLHLQASS